MAVNEYAIIDGNEVVNIILLDEAHEYTPPTGNLIIRTPESENVGIGWTRVGDEWIAPNEPPVPAEPVEDPNVTAAKYAGLQELIDVGISDATARRILGLPVEE